MSFARSQGTAQRSGETQSAGRRRAPWDRFRPNWSTSAPWAPFAPDAFGVRADVEQPKLRVSHPADAHEQEADRLADRMMGGGTSQAVAGVATAVIQRKCASCSAENASEDRDEIQRKAAPTGGSLGAGAAGPQPNGGGPGTIAAGPQAVSEAVRDGGQALPAPTRAFFEQRLERDLAGVRVHTGAVAAASARALEARAYTLGNDIVFGTGEFAPDTSEGSRLLAHELVHVAQQASGDDVIRRACLSGATCASPSGSSSAFGTAVESREDLARKRRARMSPARQRASGHAGPARQLEKLLEAEAPGLRSNIHGLFIDQDMDPDVAASTEDCSEMVPPITGATKPCVFVPAHLNQEALTFNTNPAAATIGGQAREGWRIDTVQTLVHEVQHVLYDAVSARPIPAGVSSCARADVDHELSELNAIMSEFPTVFSAVGAGAPPGDPAVVRLNDWFRHSITNPGESVRGILTTVRCKCSCPDADAFVRETFAFVTSGWPAAPKDAFNAELRKPVWALAWPL